MSTISTILVSILFIGAVAGLAYALARGTKKDADRWLVDRRVSDRRAVTEAHVPERRINERRTPEDPRQSV